MKRALIRNQLLVVLAALAAASLAAVLNFNNTLIQEEETHLRTMTQAASSLYDEEQDHNAQVQALAEGEEGLRVTLIGADGTVLADTEARPEEMENHLNRPEIQAALQERQLVVTRSSATLGTTMMYAVAVNEDGSFLRLSMEAGDLWAVLARVLPALGLGALIAIVLAFLLSERLTGRVMEPVQQMSRQMKDIRTGRGAGGPVHCPFPELQEVADQVQQATAEVGAYLRQLEREKRKTNYILNHLEEGFLLVDGEKNILLVNQSAQRQLSCGEDCLGQSLGRVIPSPQAVQLVQEVQDTGQGRHMDFNSGGRIYDIHFRRASEKAGLKGRIILTLTDVTEDRNSTRVRQEFFSNASHELKTPITAIKGNTELLCSGLPLTEEQKMELLGRIGAETERMNSMIQDIIMLSRLESGALRREREWLDLAPILEESVREWEGPAAARQVTISCTAQSAFLYASRKNLEELADNLISNGVKYNRPGGRVEVALTLQGESCVLTVRNDGDPIPPEHQRRVFERFYRVDKGRSRSAGGTGLGLSIVKHVVDSLEGRIRLESTRELGTRFTVTLPCKQGGRQPLTGEGGHGRIAP